MPERHRARSAAVSRASALAVLLAVALGAEAQRFPPAGAWTQWGGPDRDFKVASTGLAESWPATGPTRLWARPLGTGHSAILAHDGRLYTMDRRGDGMSKDGPWDASERVVALDAGTGETVWSHEYASPIQDFARGPGPHSTPLIANGRLFTLGTNRELFAFDLASHEVVWSHDLVREMGSPPLLVRPIVKSGYAASPVAYRDLVICLVGGPGQSVVAFRQSDGGVAWKSGHFLISGATPLLIEVDGETQLVVFGGSLIAGLDPDDGAILWAHAHDAGNDFNFSLPLWGDDQILFLSSAYRAGSRGLALHRENGITKVDELWFTSRVKFQFLNAVRVGDTVYGTHGETSTSFLTAVDIRTGESRWRVRGIPQSTLLWADGKLVILTEDGELVLARPGAEGLEELARAQIFKTRAWTVPTLVGTTLYARDRAEIVALDLGAASTGVAR